MWDDVEGVVSTKFPLSIVSVIDTRFGTAIPVAFVLHKRKGAVLNSSIKRKDHVHM